MTEPAATPDLRRARRQRGIDAVIDTAVEIFMQGDERPTATEIARRAGVSTSSLFRYFESVDDLRAQVAARYMEEHQDLLEPQLPDGADFAERRRLYVDVRIRTGAILGPVNRRLQGRVVKEPGLVPIQSRFRAIVAGQVEAYFGPELELTTPARRADLVSLIDSMSSIEAFQILSEIHGRTEAQVRRTWLSALDAILRPAPAPD